MSRLLKSFDACGAKVPKRAARSATCLRRKPTWRLDSEFCLSRRPTRKPKSEFCKGDWMPSSRHERRFVEFKRSNMPAPQVERTGGAIMFQWPDYHLSIRLDRFRDARNGGAFAEFVATTTAPGYAPHLTQAQLNLTAMRTRTEFVKRLSALYQEANWDEVIETVCACNSPNTACSSSTSN